MWVEEERWGCCISHQHHPLLKRYQITQQIMNIDKQFNFFLGIFSLLRLLLCLWERSKLSYRNEKMIYFLGKNSRKLACIRRSLIDFSKGNQFRVSFIQLNGFFLMIDDGHSRLARYMLLSISYRKLSSHSFTFYYIPPAIHSLFSYSQFLYTE